MEKLLATFRKKFLQKTRKNCVELKIDLLEVPYYHLKTDRDLYDFIINELTERGYILDLDFEQIPWKVFYLNLPQLRTIQQLAISKGGKCLTEEYINNGSSMKFECELGHVFLLLPTRIKKGEWCLVCEKARKKAEGQLGQ